MGDGGRRNRRQQLVAKGEPVDNNISFDGKTKDFLNMFAVHRSSAQYLRINTNVSIIGDDKQQIHHHHHRTFKWRIQQQADF